MSNACPMRDLAIRIGLGCHDFSPPEPLDAPGPDGSLRVYDWGGAGPPVLLLHGGGLTGRTWDFACLLLRSDYRLLAMDLRGHGDSHWSERYDLAQHVGDVLGLVDTLGLEGCHLVGMSLGGVVAALAARAAPAVFASLTLVDVAPGVDFASTEGLRDFFIRHAEADSVEAVVAAACLASPRTDRRLLDYRMRNLMRRTAQGGWRWKQDRRRPFDYGAILAVVARLDQVAAASGLPVLLARGGRSRVLDDRAALAFAAAVPGARLTIVPDAGHNVQEDNPTALAAALRRFWPPDR
ncbi:pimeloyl-ACP methyl ester carboxylesterase [Caulobacter ginsengisoli]|uniref:Pimeloyl-ACP methyl ester carboxylesterase n=1 Tax=Caulobacter ginsengisoli TaxID=400775 RepID=A0ABU0ISQ2_9CAUL|nr:alpha/beta hydrolase [Caulobacter ginsengisoli]MDQ0464054.1 pimeloyl-ACP methyl ester carboxylesterase [Caulobacter ginsengisoli]